MLRKFDWRVRSLFTAICFLWIRSVGVTHRPSSERIIRGQWRWTKIKLNGLKLAQEIQARQRNNYLSEVSLALFKIGQVVLRLKSPLCITMYSPIAQAEHICSLTETHCVSLGYLWLNFKEDKKIFSFKIILLNPKSNFQTMLRSF